MNNCRKATIDGFNEYIGSLKADKDNKYFVTLTQFDSTNAGVLIEDTFTDVKLSEVEDLTEDTFQPRGTTPLHDAIGESMRQSANRLKEKKGNNAVVMIVMTDGGENSSKEFDASIIKKMIDTEEADGWTVTYMGANQNAHRVGGSLGFKAGKTMNYSTDQMQDTFRGLAINTASRSSLYSKTLDSMESGATPENISMAFASVSRSADFFEDEDEDAMS